MDWNAIKKEYIEGGTSYRKLADKYGVSLTNLTRRAGRENWVSLRQQTALKTAAKISDAVSDKQSKRYERLQAVTDKLLTKLEGIVERVTLEEMELDKYTMKQITGALKDIKDIQNIKSPEDMAEQKARIAKLQHDAEKESDTATSIEVTFAAGPDEWNE